MMKMDKFANDLTDDQLPDFYSECDVFDWHSDNPDVLTRSILIHWLVKLASQDHQEAQDRLFKLLSSGDHEIRVGVDLALALRNFADSEET